MGRASSRPAHFVFGVVFAAAPVAFASSAAPPPAAAAPPPAATTTEARSRPLFEGVRPFVGVVAASGVGLIPDRSRLSPFPILRFAVTTGIFLGRAELGAELAPFSMLYVLQPMVNAHAYVGYHIRLMDGLSWPIRAGAGVTWWPIGATLPQLRADLVGLSMQSGRWLIDLQLPSVRIERVRGDYDKTIYLSSILFGAGFSFVP